MEGSKVLATDSGAVQQREGLENAEGLLHKRIVVDKILDVLNARQDNAFTMRDELRLLSCVEVSNAPDSGSRQLLCHSIDGGHGQARVSLSESVLKHNGHSAK